MESVYLSCFCALRCWRAMCWVGLSFEIFFVREMEGDPHGKSVSMLLLCTSHGAGERRAG